jgi:hypothetical protein
MAYAITHGLERLGDYGFPNPPEETSLEIHNTQTG